MMMMMMMMMMMIAITARSCNQGIVALVSAICITSPGQTGLAEMVELRGRQ